MAKEKTNKKEQVLLDGFKIFLDAEWTSSNTLVSVQVLITNPKGFEGRYIVINSIYEGLVDKRVIDKWSESNNTSVIFCKMGEDYNAVHALLKEYYLKENPLGENLDYYFSDEVFIFYSFQDLSFGFGWNNLEKQLLKELSSKSKKKIEQRRSIMGTLKIENPDTSRINTWKIRDLSGWAKTSLKQFATSVEIPIEKKELLDKYKSSMDEGFKKDY